MFTLSDKGDWGDKLLFLMAVFAHIARSEPGFKEHGLSIAIQINMYVVGFLDTQLNLINNIYKPYRKPNNNPVYINKDSNHPTLILKELR